MHNINMYTLTDELTCIVRICTCPSRYVKVHTSITKKPTPSNYY